MTPRLALAALSTALGASALVALTAGTATAGAPVVDINPPRLASGTTTLAHLEGTTIVDGAVRIPVSGSHPRLLGRSGSGYVVESSRNDRTSRTSIVRYAADGTTTQLGKADGFSSRLSQDGTFVVGERVRQRGAVRSELTAYDATTGAVLGTRTVAGYASVLDADAGKVVLGSFEPTAGTSVWTPAGDTLTRISRRIGQAADLRHDLLASFTKDPYQHGDTVVSRLSAPGQRLWTSTSERVQTFSTDGSRMALVGILDDGIGPGGVAVRSIGGRRLVTYNAQGGWFGDITFESPTALVLDTHATRRTALVRCVDTTCTRVGPLSRTTY